MEINVKGVISAFVLSLLASKDKSNDFLDLKYYNLNKD